MKSLDRMNRVMVYHHYDCDDKIDAHIIYQLKAFHDYGIAILFVSNSQLTQEEQEKIKPVVDSITIRSNEGFDWGAWKQVLMTRGKDYFSSFDELVLVNCSCYGPLFPLSEMFDKMDQEACDYWMPTRHASAMGFPAHGQPYLAVFRQPLFTSDAFWKFWDTLPSLATMYEAVWQGEIRLSSELSHAGYAGGYYYDSGKEEAVPEIGHVDPFCMNSSDFLIKQARMPFIKVKSVTERFARHYSIAGYFFDALRDAKSGYPRELILNHIRRTQAVSCQRSLPGSVALLSEANGASKDVGGRIAVCVYFTKSEDLDVSIGGCRHLSLPLDLLALVDRESCVNEIKETIAQQYPCFHTLTIRVCPNQAIRQPCCVQVFHDLFAHYDYIVMVRNHMPLDIPAIMQCRMGPPWLASIFSSENYLSQLLHLFHSEAQLGLVAPVLEPMLALGKKMPMSLDAGRVQKLNDLGIRLRKESHVPVLTTGPFMIRASILRQLADRLLAPQNELLLKTLDEEDLLDALPYVAQAFGFYYQQVALQDELLAHFNLYEDFICSVQFNNKIIHYHRLSFKEMCSEVLKVFQGYLFYSFPGISRVRTRLRCSRKGIPFSGV
jgi:rhamnosyltransferase